MTHVFYIGFVIFAWNNHFLPKTAQIPLFLLGAVQKTLYIRWFLLPEAKHIVNTVLLGFRGATKIGI